jgi:hypothetical protein
VCRLVLGFACSARVESKWRRRFAPDSESNPDARRLIERSPSAHIADNSAVTSCPADDRRWTRLLGLLEPQPSSVRLPPTRGERDVAKLSAESLGGFQRRPARDTPLRADMRIHAAAGGALPRSSPLADSWGAARCRTVADGVRSVPRDVPSAPGPDPEGGEAETNSSTRRLRRARQRGQNSITACVALMRRTRPQLRHSDKASRSPRRGVWSSDPQWPKRRAHS